ncbi:hypothetical protein D3C85_173520 [compost metagenome]
MGDALHGNDRFLRQVPIMENQQPIMEQILQDYAILNELPIPYVKQKAVHEFCLQGQKAQKSYLQDLLLSLLPNLLNHHCRRIYLQMICMFRLRCILRTPFQMRQLEDVLPNQLIRRFLYGCNFLLPELQFPQLIQLH